MKNVITPILLFISFAAFAQTKYTTVVSVDEFQKDIKQDNVQVLDVRTAGEFKTGYIKHALQADWTNKKQFTDRIQYVDKNKPVYIYCLSGGRSAAAANWMRQNGFEEVVELKGGINAWKAADKPLVNQSDEKQMTMEDFLEEIPKKKTALVDVGASWCPPCIKMKPVVKALKDDKDLDFKFINIDAGVETNLLKALQIDPIPVFIIYKNGIEVWRKTGIVSFEELKTALQ